ncbi:putative MHC class I antigen protein [Naja naja]|nr:putative MHC class I antigen protein [Naja naja]
MEKVGKEDHQYWERETQISHQHEGVFKENLETLRNRYNQSEGLHTLQRMYGCELCADGTKEGFEMYGYDGRTFLIFDTETLTWVALVPQAQITQRKLDALPALNQRIKVYLEETCIEWLKKYLSYGKETLQRTEPPEVTVRGKTEVKDGMETHVCRLDGFYPREINASWTRDGEVWKEETFNRSLAPNADGTYHSWLSIQIDPKERGRYRCHVEHDGLQEPLDLALEEPTNSKSNLMFIIIGCVMAVLVLAFLVISVVLVVMKPRIMEFFKRRQDYRAAATRLFLEVESSRRNFWDKETLRNMRRPGWWKVPLTEDRLCFPRRQRGKAWPNGTTDRGSNSSGRGKTRLFSSPLAVETPSIKREE